MVCKLLSHGGEILIPDRLLGQSDRLESRHLAIRSQISALRGCTVGKPGHPWMEQRRILYER